MSYEEKAKKVIEMEKLNPKKILTPEQIRAENRLENHGRKSLCTFVGTRIRGKDFLEIVR